VIVSCITALEACTIVQLPVSALSPATRTESRRLISQVTVHVPSGRMIVLMAGTTFDLVGRVPQGEIFAPQDRMLTVRGPNAHEAYLVVENDVLQGFYLAVERTFTPIKNKVPLQFD